MIIKRQLKFFLNFKVLLLCLSNKVHIFFYNKNSSMYTLIHMTSIA